MVPLELPPSSTRPNRHEADKDGSQAIIGDRNNEDTAITSRLGERLLGSRIELLMRDLVECFESRSEIDD